MASPDPGWYDDPSDPELLRYWNGHEWTPHRTSKPTDASAQTNPTEPSAVEPLPDPAPEAVASSDVPESDADDRVPTVQEALGPTSVLAAERRRSLALIAGGILGLLIILGALLLTGNNDDGANVATAPGLTPEPTAEISDEPTEATATPTVTPVPPTVTPVPSTPEPTATPNPFEPAVATWDPLVVRVEAVGCGTVEVGSGIVTNQAAVLTSQRVVTLAERVGLLANGQTTQGAYLGVNAERVAIVAGDLPPQPFAVVVPQIDQQISIVWRANDGNLASTEGTVTRIDDKIFEITLADGSLVPDTTLRGGAVIDIAGSLLGVARNRSDNTVIANLSLEPLAEIDIPEGPLCQDAEKRPERLVPEIALALQDPELRTLAAVQALVSAQAAGAWDDARVLNPALAEYSDVEFNFLFSTWRHAVVIPIDIGTDTAVVGIVVHTETSDGDRLTSLDCTVYTFDDGQVTASQGGGTPPTVISTDSWLDTGAQRSAAIERCR